MTRAAADEARARQRFIILNAVRIGGLVMLLAGIAMARGVIPGPYALGAGLAVAGLLDFYFGPRLLARSWKAGGKDRP